MTHNFQAGNQTVNAFKTIFFSFIQQTVTQYLACFLHSVVSVLVEK